MKTTQSQAMDATGQDQIKPSSRPRYRTWLARVGLLGYVSLVGSQSVLAQSDLVPTEVSTDAMALAPVVEITSESTLLVAPRPTVPATKAVSPAPKSLPADSPVAPPVVTAAPSEIAVAPASPTASTTPAAPVTAAVPETPISAPTVTPAPAVPVPSPTPVIPAAPETAVPEPAAATGVPQSQPAESVNPAPAEVIDNNEAAPNRDFDVVTPNELVPNSIPTAGNVPADFGSVFVDTNNYSVGATNSPNVVVAERSTGCQYTLQQGQGLAGNACGVAIPQAGAVLRNDGTLASIPSGQPSGSAGTAPSFSIGPVTVSQSGVRVAGRTSAASREYYARLSRPVVNLQLGEQFVFPLAIPAPITSLFGWRFHPIHAEQRFHSGTDLGAPLGTPVLATQAGQVAAADFLGGYGLTVILRHSDNTLETRYAHLSHLLVQPGEQVEKGDVVGLVGSTGNSTGPHLHFEVRQLTADGWVAVSPDNVLQYALANLMNGLENPLQAMNLPTAKATDSNSPQKSDLADLKALPFRPAQPNAN